MQDDFTITTNLEVLNKITNVKHTVWYTSIILADLQDITQCCDDNSSEIRHQVLVSKMVAFLREIQNCKGRLAMKKKIIFHCQTGVSNSGVMLLSDIVLQELTDSLCPVKPINLLEPLKIVRPHFLPEAKYLKMVYQVLSEYLGYNERFIS